MRPPSGAIANRERFPASATLTMAKTFKNTPVSDYRHDSATRKNNPPAGLAPQGRVKDAPRIAYSYDPHLPPVLRFDQTAASDRAAELVAKARATPLSADEARELEALIRHRKPWLEWAGKREAKGFEVDPIALHIHERISTQAILKSVQREDVQRDIFADPQQPFGEALRFYEHDVDWANRMILGDSLQVMASLARREDLAGKVQMIYMDPPYGIRFASNFQSEIGRRDVKDRDQDLTREPEMVKAYRDTWTLGVHSYLGYMRDRLVLCRELLTDSGSVFVQISDENLHRVRAVIEEVFGPENFCAIITFRKTTGQAGNLLPDTNDYLIWFAKDKSAVKFRPLYWPREGTDWVNYDYIELSTGERRRMSAEERDSLPDDAKVYRRSPLTSASSSQATLQPVDFEGAVYTPGKGGWKTNSEGFKRLAAVERLEAYGRTLSYRRYTTDFPFFPISNAWLDTASGGYGAEKVYVVQTNPKVITRCMLLTTDPGDLVFDPTCGSGTTAFVAEQWGRRWITVDTSRVALALARQRLMTATFPHFVVKGDSGDKGAANPSHGFVYKTAPRIMLRSIVQNAGLDGVVEKHQSVLDDRLSSLNQALRAVSADLRNRLKAKLKAKRKAEGTRSITDADRRRWELPEKEWKEWEVPFDTDPDWPEPLRKALIEYRTAWRTKMDEVDGLIAASADQEDLTDQPEVERGISRVAGPFTMEAVMPAEQTLSSEEFGGAPEGDLETFDREEGPTNAEAFLDRMVRYLKEDGVRFPDNKVSRFERLEFVQTGDVLHAEGEWTSGNGDAPRRVAVSFGPEHGPVTAVQVESALWAASRQGYDDLVFAGFSFDGAAQAAIQDDPNPRVRIHMAHVAPNVHMGDLLKTNKQQNSQLFTVFGSPRTKLNEQDGEWSVEMQGVDIYDPVENTIRPTGADKVAAWFVDSDYDGRTFCITQAFFPDRKAWDKIARALKGSVDDDAMEALSGTTSLPFRPGQHRRVAVKVIDPRGNEVMRVHRLESASY
jgi:adenine-specific DNA-methyltransferase